MLRAILNKSWKQHPTKQQLCGHLPPITKTIQVRRIRHARQCWRSRDELISDVLLLTPSHVRAKTGRPARTYIQRLCANTGCSLEDWKRWTIEKGGEKGSWIPGLMAQHDDDDELRSVSKCMWCKIKLTTFIDGNPKAPFSIATTLKYSGGRYSIPD